MGQPPLVVISEPVHEAGRRLLAEHCRVVMAPNPSPAALRPLLWEASALLVRLAVVSAELVAAAPHLRVIARHGVGVERDAVPSPCATACGRWTWRARSWGWSAWGA
ncbi:MAG: hypothetical protein QN152_13185 [Armatimonadota bacterium]|nr:hypothetical protein [Armatimonadota bacterium]MDR7426958.1 hypothetical protein [Armatimonadota bacterium]MDR7464972.1 hypothetical protein [Armatimonadota bacterium]MDR7470628.1 hypothetical protein [Armatimonadota bacterium]MDR7474223.1 hypothetical protein [Armatimonadota bacterium]